MRSVVEQNAQSYALSESKLLKGYIAESLEYLSDISRSVTIDPMEYTRIIMENPEIPRQQAIKQSIRYGELPKKKPRMDMAGLVRNSREYVEKVSEFESIVYVNARYMAALGQRAYPTKTWLWSGKKNTRHRGMSGVTIPVNDPFLVTNEKTGEACELMFPRDYARDPSGANTVNCGCDVLYNQMQGDKLWQI